MTDDAVFSAIDRSKVLRLAMAVIGNALNHSAICHTPT